jgi:replication-associated recombination protein RarA
MDLFEQSYQQKVKTEAPLAERMRPRTLDEFVGQEAEIKTQVSRHREAQLAAQIEGIGVTSIEMLTYGEDKQVERCYP